MSDSADRIWHINRRGQPIGPVSALELAWLAKAGHLKPTDFIWCRGLPDWVEAGRVAGLLPANEQPLAPAGSEVQAKTELPPEPLKRLQSVHDRFNLGAQDPFAKAAARVARGGAVPRQPPEHPAAAKQPPAVEKPADNAFFARIAGALDQPTAAAAVPAGNAFAAGTNPALAQPPSSLTVRAEPPPPAMPTDNGAAASWRELGKFDIGRSVSDAIIVALDKFAIRTLDDLAADWRLQSLAADAFDALPGTIRFLINQTVGRSVLEGYILDMLTNLKSRIPPEQRQRDLRTLIREMAATPWLSDKLSAAYAKTRTGLGSIISNYTPSRMIPQSWWSAAAVAAPREAPLMITAESAAVARAELL